MSRQKMSVGTPTDEEILQDFSPGPLDRYRKQSSFDWKSMKVFVEGEAIMRFKVSLVNSK
jgi:hypothetical protein